MNDDFPNTIPWPPRRASAQTECAADEGGEFRAPAPAKVPRHNLPLFKSDEEMRADGWEPVGRVQEAGFFVGALIAAVILVLACAGIAQLIVAVVRAAP